jgi:hypothetical protein
MLVVFYQHKKYLWLLSGTNIHWLVVVHTSTHCVKQNSNTIMLITAYSSCWRFSDIDYVIQQLFKRDLCSKSLVLIKMQNAILFQCVPPFREWMRSYHYGSWIKGAWNMGRWATYQSLQMLKSLCWLWHLLALCGCTIFWFFNRNNASIDFDNIINQCVHHSYQSCIKERSIIISESHDHEIDGRNDDILSPTLVTTIIINQESEYESFHPLIG